MQGKYLKSVVYGGLDGIITTFAIVSGVEGADLPFEVTLILGTANLFADALSMGFGDWISAQAELDHYKHIHNTKLLEIRHNKDDLKKSLVKKYTETGLSKEDAVTVVNILSKEEKTFASALLRGRLGERESPIVQGLVTFVSFLVFGSVPIIAYANAEKLQTFFFRRIEKSPNLLKTFMGLNKQFLGAVLITGVMLFILGVVKVLISLHFFFLH